MTPPSNETLDFKISAMEKQNKEEHKALFTKVDGIENKLDMFMEKLENKFVMRAEFKVAIGLLGAFATILSIISFISDK